MATRFTPRGVAAYVTLCRVMAAVTGYCSCRSNKPPCFRPFSVVRKSHLSEIDAKVLDQASHQGPLTGGSLRADNIHRIIRSIRLPSEDYTLRRQGASWVSSILHQADPRGKDKRNRRLPQYPESWRDDAFLR